MMTNMRRASKRLSNILAAWQMPHQPICTLIPKKQTTAILNGRQLVEISLVKPSAQLLQRSKSLPASTRKKQRLYQEKEDDMISKYITSKLRRGKVLVFSQGDKCILTGSATRKAKRLLEDSFIGFEEIDVSQLSPGEEHATRVSLDLHTGFNQFPNIFFGEEHIGGYDDLTGYFSVQKIAEKVMDSNGIQPTTTATELSEDCCHSPMTIRRATKGLQQDLFKGLDGLRAPGSSDQFGRGRVFTM